mgnify:FL=1
MVTVNDVTQMMFRWAPPELAMDWDNVGLLVGRGDREVHRVLVALEDLLFCMLYALFVSAFSFGFARGHLRWYFPGGNLLGFTVYYLTAGRVVMGVIHRILGILRRILRVLLLPFAKGYALIREKTIPVFVGTLQKSKKAEKK